MAEQTSVDQLKAFRQILVEKRRKVVANALHLRAVNGDGGLWGAEVQKLQEQIDATDRAITDEEALEPSVYESRGILTV
jgi:hypothetical protein